jgi:predicted glutamine amidotransferase
MCRLFGMSAAPQRVRATFWLIDAPDSLALQSRKEPDGVGIGVFEPDGTPLVYKEPVAAYADTGFAREAHDLTAGTFIAHIRYATTGSLTPVNTHPFCQDGRLFAHNGMVAGLDRLDEKIRAEGGDGLVRGDTDSERIFALITAYAREGRDPGQAIADAVGWIAAHLPVYAVNLILTTPTDLWALRYPETHKLYLLERGAGGGHGNRHLDHASAAGTVRVRSADLADVPAVVVATERMDEDPGWRLLESGELLHVGPGPQTERRIVLGEPPVHLLTRADLHPHAAAAQASGVL